MSNEETATRATLEIERKRVAVVDGQTGARFVFTDLARALELQDKINAKGATE